MKIYAEKNNPYDVVDAILEHGVSVIEGTKTSALNYSNRVMKCLYPYENVVQIQGYENVRNNGYLYYIFDGNRFQIGDQELKKTCTANRRGELIVFGLTKQINTDCKSFAASLCSFWHPVICDG